jgi:hypothetical protein
MLKSEDAATIPFIKPGPVQRCQSHPPLKINLIEAIAPGFLLIGTKAESRAVFARKHCSSVSKKTLNFSYKEHIDLITTLQHQKFQQSLSLHPDGKYIGKT